MIKCIEIKKVQLILKERQPEYALVPYEMYTQLVDNAEMLEDIRDFDEAMKRIDEALHLMLDDIVR